MLKARVVGMEIWGFEMGICGRVVERRHDLGWRIGSEKEICAAIIGARNRGGGIVLKDVQTIGYMQCHGCCFWCRKMLLGKSSANLAQSMTSVTTAFHGTRWLPGSSSFHVDSIYLWVQLDFGSRVASQLNMPSDIRSFFGGKPAAAPAPEKKPEVRPSHCSISWLATTNDILISV